MEQGGTQANISVIFDFFDDVRYSQVFYEYWLSNALPLARIDRPAWGERFEVGEAITFVGRATDPEDGVLDASRIEWRDSGGSWLADGDAITLSTLTQGCHEIWLYAMDSSGQSGRIPVTVNVGEDYCQ